MKMPSQIYGAFRAWTHGRKCVPNGSEKSFQAGWEAACDALLRHFDGERRAVCIVQEAREGKGALPGSTDR